MAGPQLPIRILINGATFGICISMACAAGEQKSTPDINAASSAFNKIIADDLAKRTRYYAENRILEGFIWNYDFDGTEAELFGLSKGASTDGVQPQLTFEFKCSRKWLRLSVNGNEFGEEHGPTNSTLFLNQSPALKFGSMNILVALPSEPSSLPSDLSKLTRDLYRDKSLELKFISGVDSKIYRLRKSAYEAVTNRLSVAKFREKCAIWWREF